MKKSLRLLENFNNENGLFHSIRIYSDGSGHIYNAFDEVVYIFKKRKKLIKKLKNN
jgi:hypothetical protein